MATDRAADDAARDLPRWAWLVPGAVALLVYARVVGFPFVDWDDPLYVTQNGRVLDSSLEGLLSLWDPRPAHQGLFVEYFPLRDSLYWLLHAVFGRTPAAFHALVVMLHAAVCVLLGPILVRWGAHPSGALVGALVFAVHPVHVESVAWVSALKDPLFVLFTLAILERWTAGDSRRHTLQATGLLACGLLVKAMIVVVPAQLFLLDVILRRRPLKQSLLRVALPLGVAALFLGHFIAIGRANGVVLPYKGGTFFTGALTGLWSLTIYLSKLLVPIDLNARYLVEPLLTPFSLRGITALGVGGGLTLAAAFVARRYAAASFTWLFYLAGLCTVLGFVPINIEVADRYQYEASISFSLVVALGFMGVRSRAGGRAAWTLALLYVAVLAAGSYRRSEVWSSSGLLWLDVMDQPGGEDFPIAKVNLALALLDAGMVDRGIAELDEVARSRPRTGPGLIARVMLADEAMARGDLAEAEAWLSPRSDVQAHAEGSLSLALLALHRNDVDGARRAIAEGPRRLEAWWPSLVRGAVLLASGDEAGARNALERAARLNAPSTCHPRDLARFPGPLKEALLQRLPEGCGS